MRYIDNPKATTWQEAIEWIDEGGDVFTPLMDNLEPDDIAGVTCWQVEREELIEWQDEPFDMDLYLIGKGE